MNMKQRTLDGKTIDIPTRLTHKIMVYSASGEEKAGYVPVATDMTTEELTEFIRKKLGLICHEPKGK